MSGKASFGAIILAGGKSTRLGRDKASALLLGRTLLHHVVDRVSLVADEIICVRAPEQELPAIDTPVAIVEDLYPGTGPLGGIYTGLRAAASTMCLAVACDMPLLSVSLLEELLRRAGDCDAVMPVREFPEPLHAVYTKACLGPMRETIEAGRYKITAFLGAVHVCYVKDDELRRFDPEGHSFLNTNTEEDLALAASLISALRDGQQ
jgi:molybdopterin-guanine dinucleotide biosynthesis protein A